MLGKSMAHERIVANATLRQPSDCGTVTVVEGGTEPPENGGGTEPPEDGNGGGDQPPMRGGFQINRTTLLLGGGALAALFFLM